HVARPPRWGEQLPLVDEDGEEYRIESYPALLTFLWVPVHDQMRAHAVPCLVFPAYQRWKRS
ncbi:MAG: hypothetical protein ACRETH_08695, partial [Steroidobacteraceae bacterium]